MARFKTQIKEVELSLIDLVEKNAHFMDQDTFRQLIANIKRDGQLTSVPFLVEHNTGRYTVISGNHRVQAAKMAGIVKASFIVVHEDDITKDEILAIQLSHNSIVGQDDSEILKELLEEITDVAMKEYAHISNEILDAVKDVDYVIDMPNNEIVPVTLMFVDTNKFKFDKLMETLDTLTPRELENTTLVNIETLRKLNDTTSKVGQKYGIKSQALSICKMIELVNIMLDGEERTTEAGN